MKNKFTVGSLISMIIMGLSSFVFGLTAEVPGVNSQDVVGVGNVSSGGGGDFALSGIFGLINTYIWLGLGIVGMILMMWGGYNMIAGEGNPDELKKANKMIIYGLIGIVISISSYLIVDLLATLY